MRSYPMPPNFDAHTEYTTGILASQTIKGMIASGKIISEANIIERQIQPASIDLRSVSYTHLTLPTIYSV